MDYDGSMQEKGKAGKRKRQRLIKRFSRPEQPPPSETLLKIVSKCDGRAHLFNPSRLTEVCVESRPHFCCVERESLAVPGLLTQTSVSLYILHMFVLYDK